MRLFLYHLSCKEMQTNVSIQGTVPQPPLTNLEIIKAKTISKKTAVLYLTIMLCKPTLP